MERGHHQHGSSYLCGRLLLLVRDRHLSGWIAFYTKREALFLHTGGSGAMRRSVQAQMCDRSKPDRIVVGRRRTGNRLRARIDLQRSGLLPFFGSSNDDDRPIVDHQLFRAAWILVMFLMACKSCMSWWLFQLGVWWLQLFRIHFHITYFPHG